MNYFQTIRDAAILLALLIIPAIFLRANLRDPSKLSWLDRALLQVTTTTCGLRTIACAVR
jgi:hypothetical protein